MTRPSNTELREALERILIDGFADQDLSNNEKVPAMTNTLLKLFQAREQQAIPKFSDMPEGNADFMEGFRVACLQMEANLERYREGL